MRVKNTWSHFVLLGGGGGGQYKPTLMYLFLVNSFQISIGLQLSTRYSFVLPSRGTRPLVLHQITRIHSFRQGGRWQMQRWPGGLRESTKKKFINKRKTAKSLFLLCASLLKKACVRVCDGWCPMLLTAVHTTRVDKERWCLSTIGTGRALSIGILPGPSETTPTVEHRRRKVLNVKWSGWKAVRMSTSRSISGRCLLIFVSIHFIPSRGGLMDICVLNIRTPYGLARASGCVSVSSFCLKTACRRLWALERHQKASLANSKNLLDCISHVLKCCGHTGDLLWGTVFLFVFLMTTLLQYNHSYTEKTRSIGLT